MRQCTLPSAACAASTSPYRGGFGWLPPRTPPLQGEVSPQVTEGCGTLPGEYPSGLPHTAEILPWFMRQCTLPSAACAASTSPCRGGFGWPPPRKPPLQGEVSPQVTEGCGALPGLYRCRLSVRCLRIRRGRCLHCARRRVSEANRAARPVS